MTTSYEDSMTYSLLKIKCRTIICEWNPWKFLGFSVVIFSAICCRKNAYKSMRTGHGPKVKVRMSELSKVIYGQKSVEELTGILCIFSVLSDFMLSLAFYW